MARGELVHAVTHAIRTHRLDRFSHRELAVAILDVVEPLIRADERKRNAIAEVERADLRTQVLALRDDAPSGDVDFDEGWYEGCKAVLDLIDGGGDA